MENVLVLMVGCREEDCNTFVTCAMPHKIPQKLTLVHLQFVAHWKRQKLQIFTLIPIILHKHNYLLLQRVSKLTQC